MTHTNHQHLPNLLDLADSALRPLDGLADLRLAHPLLCHRNPHLANAVDAMARIGRLQGQGYRLIGAFDGNRLAAVAGYRFQENLLFGRFLSPEDLITADTHQGADWSCRLLLGLERLARAEGYLCLVVEHHGGQPGAEDRYRRSGLIPSSIRYSKLLITD